jgi:ABC-2 type transport system permease protein
MVGAAWLFALAHPLLLLLAGNDLSAERLPAWLAFLFGSEGGLTERAEWMRFVVLGFILPVMMVIFSVWYGSGLIAGEEERGSLGLLLAGSILRHRVITSKFGALLLMVFVPSTALWLAVSLLVWLQYFPAPLLFISRASASLFLLGLAFGTLAMALGSLTGRHRLSRRVTLAFALVSLLLYRLPVNFPGGKIIRLLSPFYYYSQAVLDQLFLPHAAVLALLVSACLIFAWRVFEQRDLAV